MSELIYADRRRPWYHVGHRMLGNPFTPMGEAYCLKCHEWGSASAEARYEGAVYAMKEWCRKCGAIINYAVWDGEFNQQRTRQAVQWATSTEQGRDSE